MSTGKFDINELKRRMQGATQSLKHELGGLRTGRAAASMLEPVQVEAYGSHMPLNQALVVQKTIFKGDHGSPADRVDFTAFANATDCAPIAARVSRSASRFLRSSRLSKFSLPLPTASNTFTRPFFQ